MLVIKGRYNNAVIYTDDIDDSAVEQIRELCDQPFIEGRSIRIMPDAHAGAGCVIGTTMDVRGCVVPNLVGVDIGCGMQVTMLGHMAFSDRKLNDIDRIIRDHVPSGRDVRDKAHRYISDIHPDRLRCRKDTDLQRARLSIGTLGGGNHFIELNVDPQGNSYLVVHSGSRHLGKQVAEHYQKRAASEDRVTKNKALAHLSGDGFVDYLHDMAIAQEFANINRFAVTEVILSAAGLKAEGSFTTIHNYIDTSGMMLRKGAVSAALGELLIIPVNMRDGSIIAKGLGNAEWNFSAPHGAGRIMSRTQAKKTLSMDKFRESMKGIHSSTVSRETLDEAPFAYRPMEEILENIRDTVEVVSHIKPVYNFKAAEG